MIKTVKSLVSVFLVLIMLLSVCAVNVFAAGTVISFSKSSVSVGDTVKVTVTFNAGEAMYALSGVLNYDSSILEYKSGSATGSGGVLKIVESPSGETKYSDTYTFTAKKAGSCTVSLSDCFYSALETDKGLSGSSAKISVTDKTLSSNANLKSMYLSNGSLSPAFSPSVTTYEVKVQNSVTECLISATPADSAAKVSVEGSATLKIGKNTRKVIVTAPNGTTKTYTVNITRSETDEEFAAEENPLEVEIDGSKLLLATDISSEKLFNGFTASQADFNDTKVAVAVDDAGEYVIYYMRTADSNTLVPYVYDEENEVFEKLQYFIQGENSYIFADLPADMTVPESFYPTNAQISGMNIKCYASSDGNMSDFYYIYCYSNGKYGFYRYDSLENVLQRYPELEIVPTSETVEEVKPGGFAARFNSLTTNAKIIVISLVLLILAAIVLIVILVIRLIKRRSYGDFDDGMISDEDFDSINIDNYPISDVNKPEEREDKN